MPLFWIAQGSGARHDFARRGAHDDGHPCSSTVLVLYTGGAFSQFTLLYLLLDRGRQHLLQLRGTLALATMATGAYLGLTLLEGTGIVAPVLRGHATGGGATSVLWFLPGSTWPFYFVAFLSAAALAQGRAAAQAPRVGRRASFARARFDTDQILESLSSGLLTLDGRRARRAPEPRGGGDPRHPPGEGDRPLLPDALGESGAEFSSLLERSARDARAVPARRGPLRAIERARRCRSASARRFCRKAAASRAPRRGRHLPGPHRGPAHRGAAPPRRAAGRDRRALRGHRARDPQPLALDLRRRSRYCETELKADRRGRALLEARSSRSPSGSIASSAASSTYAREPAAASRARLDRADSRRREDAHRAPSEALRRKCRSRSSSPRATGLRRTADVEQIKQCSSICAERRRGDGRARASHDGSERPAARRPARRPDPDRLSRHRPGHHRAEI